MPRKLDPRGVSSSLLRTAAAAALLLAAPPGLQAQEKGEGPAKLFLTYRCKPEKRAAFRAHMAGPGVSEFEKWKREGTFKDYLILFTSYVNAATWDMLVRLDFDKYADTQRWEAVERTMPGGLSAEALALCSPVTAYLADLIWETAGPARDLAKTRYLVIPYQFHVGKPVYKNYFEAYVEPQMDGWIAEKAMSWWGVYLNQHNTGAPWDSLFLLEYTDPVGLARRDNVKEAVRKKLQENPAWKTVSDAKADFREEDQVVIAAPILPR